MHNNESPQVSSNYEKEELLLKAVSQGALSLVEELIINQKADINYKNDQGNTVLHVAARDAGEAMLFTLFKHEAKTEVQNSKGATALHLAVHYNNMVAIKYLVENNANINAQTNYKTTPLHIAALKEKIEIAEYLVQKGAEINSQDDEGATPLYLAAKGGFTESCRLLIKSKANLNIKNVEGISPFYKAVKEGHLGVIQVLDELRINLQSLNKYKASLLFTAAQEGHLHIARYLLKGNIPFKNLINEDERTPLTVAVGYGHLELVEFFIDQGFNNLSKHPLVSSPLRVAVINRQIEIVDALIKKYKFNPNSIDKFIYTTLLSEAMDYEYIEIAKILLENGANPDLPNNDNSTALHKAASQGNIDAINLLLMHKASVDVRGNKGYTPMQEAAKRWHCQAIKILIEYGADPLIKDEEENTALHLVLLEEIRYIRKENSYTRQEKKLKVINMLVKYGVDPKVGNKENITLLHLAAKSLHYDIVKVLIMDYGLDPKTQDEKGNSSLHWLAGYKGYKSKSPHREQSSYEQNEIEERQIQLSIAGLLIEYGGNPNAQTIEGWTSLHIAAGKGNLTLLKYFVAKGGDIKVQPMNGITILHIALYARELETINYLIGQGADLNLHDKQGITLLHLAVYTNNIKLVKYLIKEKVDLNAQAQGITPLDWAIKNPNEEVVEYLIKKGANFSSAASSADKLPISAYSSFEIEDRVSRKKLLGEPYDSGSSKFSTKFSTIKDIANIVDAVYLGQEKLPNYLHNLDMQKTFYKSTLEEIFLSRLKHLLKDYGFVVGVSIQEFQTYLTNTYKLSFPENLFNAITNTNRTGLIDEMVTRSEKMLSFIEASLMSLLDEGTSPVPYHMLELSKTHGFNHDNESTKQVLDFFNSHVEYKIPGGYLNRMFEMENLMDKMIADEEIVRQMELLDTILVNHNNKAKLKLLLREYKELEKVVVANNPIEAFEEIVSITPKIIESDIDTLETLLGHYA
jgi:ankyrin repeat protein